MRPALRANQWSLLLLLLCDSFVLTVLLLFLAGSPARPALGLRLDLSAPVLQLLLVSWSHVGMLGPRGINEVFLRAQNQHFWVTVHVAFDIDDATFGTDIIDTTRWQAPRYHLDATATQGRARHVLAVLAAMVLRASHVDLLSAHLHGGLLGISALGLLHRVAGMVVMLLPFFVTIGHILRRRVRTLTPVLRSHCGRH